ncbi:MAG TPA: hypothetical protein VFP44_23045 [Usitatibacter sp.]|nr:hypothetical protein [Usitatibacter sp.]
MTLNSPARCRAGEPLVGDEEHRTGGALAENGTTAAVHTSFGET